jgi:hypothetical protein
LVGQQTPALGRLALRQLSPVALLALLLRALDAGNREGRCQRERGDPQTAGDREPSPRNWWNDRTTRRGPQAQPRAEDLQPA